ncbi:PTS system mannose/fructose/sorbose family transporter subunit IID [Luxibacter massiliensis]|uniref:PTS system mannose/fructose/sorbose family transporter subunit IID n=1 Tax=Luxibacter massiliensis TaxID=2219695 RepID=UPI000F068958|nr:PTS system mannose/fructose/sorbose family transporter subunit IID [Luxibacter massiliensis]
MSEELKNVNVDAENVEANKLEDAPLLTKKDIRKSLHRWIFACEASNNYERMQSLAFCYSMIPCLKKLYKDKEQLSNALKRHLNFFNSQAIWSSPIQGMVLSMEEEMAKTGAVSEGAITGIKTGLMGPLAGIGDTIDWGTLRLIIYSVAVTFAAEGSALGAIIPFVFPIITYFVIAKPLWFLGYRLGRSSVANILESGWLKDLIFGSSILGMFMMGALSGSYVTLATPASFTIGESSFVIQEILDSIAPGLLPLLAVFLIYYIIKNKTQKYGRISLVIIALAIILSLIGIV